MNEQINPLSRKSDLLFQELKGEVLIYDLLISKAFCLNETSAAVWQLCNGTRSISDLRKAVSKKFKRDVSNDFIRFALSQLKEKNLLQNGAAMNFDFAEMSRREAARKIGLGAMVALPMITFLVAPKAVAAQSTCTIGNPCTCSMSNPINATTGVNCRTLLGTPTGCSTATTCDCLVTAGTNQGSCVGV